MKERVPWNLIPSATVWEAAANQIDLSGVNTEPSRRFGRNPIGWTKGGAMLVCPLKKMETSRKMEMEIGMNLNPVIARHCAQVEDATVRLC